MSEWERMTPVELNIYARANEKRLHEEQQVIQGNNYMLAALIRAMIWEKYPPSYNEFFPNVPKEDMNDDEMFTVVKSLNAMFGGKEG